MVGRVALEQLSHRPGMAGAGAYTIEATITFGFPLMQHPSGAGPFSITFPADGSAVGPLRPTLPAYRPPPSREREKTPAKTRTGRDGTRSGFCSHLQTTT